MLTIFRKEISGFFSSLVGYSAIIMFLLISWFMVWMNPGTNVPDYGYSTLDPFFQVAPWLFALIIPAITMRSFAEEINTGTIELLATRPLRDVEIILGKYFAALTVVVLALLPSLVFYFTVSALGLPPGNIDSGGVFGSYIGLILLGGTYVAIGLFCSSITSSQILAFLATAALCLFLYYVVEALSLIPSFIGTLDYYLGYFAISTHYDAVSKGVVDTRDVVYFLSVIVLFVLLTKTSLESRKW